MGDPPQPKDIAITVVNHFRDLGAHISLDHTNTNTTLGNRFRKATQWVKRFRGLPISHSQKLTTIRTMVLPAALYGADVGHCPKVELQALESAIASTIGTSNKRRSVPLVMELCSTNGEIDPRIHMLTRKVVLLLRILAKYPETKVKVQALLCAYHTQHRKGTEAWLGLDGEDQHQHNFGPISHLLVDLHSMGATIGTDLTIRQEGGEAPLPLTTTPWQYIKILTDAIGQRARFKQCQQSRRHTKDIQLLDHQALHRGLRKQTKLDRGIVRYIGSGAAWTQGQLSQIGTEQGDKCNICGQIEDSIEHGLWYCQPVQAAARSIREAQHKEWKQQQVEQAEANAQA